MRPRLTSTTLAALCGISLAALGGCGKSDGGSAAAPGGGGPPAVTPIAASGTWVGSYTTVSGVAQRRLAFNPMLAMAVIGLPAGGRQEALSSPPAARTVNFTVSFIQTSGSLIGSYIDTDGNHGTVAGTVAGSDADMTVTFFAGAAGTLHLAGAFAAGADATEAGSFTGTATENYTPDGGLLLNANGNAMMGDRQEPQAPTGGQTPADAATDFTGWWRTAQTGAADKDHEGEGTQILVQQVAGTWKLFNPFVNQTAPVVGTVITLESGKLVLVYQTPAYPDGGGGTVPAHWYKESWNLIGSGSAIRADVYDGGTDVGAAWSGTPAYAYYWDRLAGPLLPALAAAPTTLAYDVDRAAVSPAGADALSVSASFDGTTAVFAVPLAGPPDQGVVYEFKLWDQVNDVDESTAPVVTASCRWDAGSSLWLGTVNQQVGFGNGTPIASGASVTVSGNSVGISLTKAAWAAATGRTPTGGSIKAWFHSPAANNAEFWAGMKDQTPFAYFKLP
jgi:hypothetical protein